MRINPPTKVYVDNSPIHGLGVFAIENISKDEVFEICPVLDLGIPKGQSSNLLLNYRFNWPEGTIWEKQVVGLGFASLYNHGNPPNANWRSVKNENVFEFYALRDINKGEEILVYYGGEEYWKDGRTDIDVK